MRALAREPFGRLPAEAAGLTDYQIAAILSAAPGDPVPAAAPPGGPAGLRPPPPFEEFWAATAAAGVPGWTRAAAEREYERQVTDYRRRKAEGG